MIEKLLSRIDDVEIKHEYMCKTIQPLAFKYHLEIESENNILRKLEKIYGSAIYYSKKKKWGDVSNKVSWLIPLLNKIFPNAKFIFLVRDGRKVVSSFFNKLKDECYDDISFNIMNSWVNNPDKFPEPPHEKKYWWNVYKKSHPEYDIFMRYNQFERISNHWKNINLTIEKDLELIKNENKFFVRLEDLVTDEEKLKSMISFLGLKYQSSLLEILKKPHNVNVPLNFSLTKEQNKSFSKIAGRVMSNYGYSFDENYEVIYDGNSSIRY